MAFSDRFLEELHEKVDIEEVVSSYVSLKRRGKTLTGLCPFHNEKTPSFTVYPDTRSFYCFGCGAGGEIITFIRKIENLDYVEAVRSLAQRAGIPMPEDGFDDTLSKKRMRILAANREAARFFNSCLMSEKNRSAYNYFIERGLSPNTITKFGLGYAPDDWRSLLNHMKSKGFSEQELVFADLALRSEKNGKANYYDKYRNRVIFPIIDLRGNVVAFGGRVLDDSKPKYINTGDTLVYKKGSGVFALNFAKSANDNRLILVEGYMDVIALHQAGFTNAIAGLGTAFTPEQANLLSRYAEEIIICYDNDNAGREATKKALSVLGKTGVKLRIVTMSGGKDADEIIRTHGKERFASLLNESANRTEYRILQERNKYNVATDDGKLKFLLAASQILAECGEIECDIYATRLSNELGVNIDSIKAQISSSRSKLKKTDNDRKKREQEKMLSKSFEDKNNPEKASNLKAARAEETLISSLMRNPDFYGKIKEKISPDDFVTSFNRRVFEKVIEIINSGFQPELGLLSGYFSPDEMSSVTRMFHLSKNLNNTVKECDDCIAVIKEKNISPVSDVTTISDEEYLKLFEKK